MTDIQWEKVAIVFLTFALGMVIGHVQEAKWTEIKLNALAVQIEKQSCSDINPWKGPTL